MNETKARAWSPDPATREILEELRAELGACMQCGTCTASCPNGFAMDVTPRQMWRMVQFGMVDRILESRTFWMCSSCYMCTLRCPRGLKLTRAMGSLKRLARLRGTWIRASSCAWPPWAWTRRSPPRRGSGCAPCASAASTSAP